jgi:elongation factor 1-beta
METAVRNIQIDGLKWLGSQLIDVAYGIKKLRILCQIIDVKISSPDIIVEEIEDIEHVQSCDIFTFQMA